jgi:hypothetical protein
MPYYGPLSYPSYVPPDDPDSLDPHVNVKVYEFDLPHGALSAVVSDSSSPSDSGYDDPLVDLPTYDHRDPTDEENLILGKAFIEDDGGIYEPFLLSYDPHFRMIMVHCQRVRTFGMTSKDCLKTAYYSYPEVLQLIQLHPYESQLPLSEGTAGASEDFQPEDGLSLVGEDVTHGLSDTTTATPLNLSSVPCGVISPDDETLLAEQAQVDLMDSKRPRTR